MNAYLSLLEKLDNKTDNLYLGSLSLNNAPLGMPEDGFPSRVPTPPSEEIDGVPPSMRRGYRPPLGRTFTFPTSSSRDGAEEDHRAHDLTIGSLDPHAPLSMMSALDALAAAASLSSPSTSFAPPPLDAHNPFGTPPGGWRSGPDDDYPHHRLDDQITSSIGPQRNTRFIDRAQSLNAPSRSTSPTHPPPRSTASTPPRDAGGAPVRRRPPRTRLPVPTPNVSRPSRGRHVPTAPGAAADGVEQPVATPASSLGSVSDGERPTPAPQRAKGKAAVKEGEEVGARVFVCEVEGCGKCFRRREHLKRHMLSLHTNDRPFQCPDCDKVCNRRDNLVQHRKIHAQDAAKP
ncbi:unnamed protein product [Peniophora sp. CBMAI 1063]|nr:unnamed protein product [Peniophora sp. CBMAI 1063]